MSSCVCVSGHIKDPVLLIEKSRALSPGGRFPPRFIHQVIIITRVIRLRSRPEDGLGCRQGVKPLKTETLKQEGCKSSSFTSAGLKATNPILKVHGLFLLKKSTFKIDTVWV